MSKAYVLHSGGIDSTVCLYLANRDYDETVAVSIDYGQRHKSEIRAAGFICSHMHIQHEIVKIPEPPRSMLTDAESEIPNANYDDLPEGVSPTYVPFRNGQLLSRIAGLAADAKADAIYFGAHAEDAQNWAYPDCTPEFVGAMANAIYIGTYHKVRLITPLQWMVKKEIIRLGEELGVPWNLTWSCYVGGTHHCGVCPTCRARRDGFEGAFVGDPTIYDTIYESTEATAPQQKYALAVSDIDGGFGVIAGPLPTIQDCQQHIAVVDTAVILELHVHDEHKPIMRYSSGCWEEMKPIETDEEVPF